MLKNNDTVKLLHVITSMKCGGAQSMLVKVIQELQKFNSYHQEVIVLTNDCDYTVELNSLNIKVHFLGLLTSANIIKSLFRMRSLIKSISPDIVQSWMYHANFIAFLSAVNRKKIIFNIRHSLHDIKKEKKPTRAMIFVGSFMSKFVYKTIYCSMKSMNQHHQIRYSQNSTYIPNGFNTNIFAPNDLARKEIRLELGLSNETIIIGSVARYHPMKNHDGLIREFGIYQKNSPQSVLLLIGEDIDNNPKLKSLINSLNLDNQIILCGRKNKIHRWLAAMDLFILPSLWGEAFPNVLGEAMSTSLPCIVSNVGDSAHILGNCGLIIEKSISSSLIEMFNLTQKDRNNLGALSRKRIVNKFSLSSTVEKYHNEYQNMCRNVQIL